MEKITYIERNFIDRFRCIDTEKTFYAVNHFINGGLTYFKLNGFNYKTVETDFIKSIETI